MIWKFPLYEIDKPLDWEAIEARFDWFRDMKEVPQDPLWHAEGDVQIHTKMVTEALIEQPEFQELSEQDKHIMLTAALLHDVEKRSTTKTQIIEGKERIVSPRHALKGEFTARSILYKDIPTPFEIREQICKLVRWHGLPLWAITKKDPRKAVIAGSLQVNTEQVALLSRADIFGRIGNHTEDKLLKIDLFKELCKEHDCYGKPHAFASDYGRYLFLNKPNIAPDYAPYDDLKSKVYVLSALAGTGKDAYIKQHFDLPILSLDAIRREHKIDPRDKKKVGKVIQLGRERAKEFLRARTDFVFNATNITKDIRSKWISLFVEYGARVKIIYLEVPYKTLLKQNNNREHKVPEVILERMIQKLEIPNYEEAHEVELVVG